MLRRTTAVILIGVLLVIAPRTTVAATPIPSWAASHAVVQAFIDAYNRHDVAAALAAVDPKVEFSDCDYVTHEGFYAHGRAQLAQSLRARFAENDQLQIADVREGYTGDNPNPDPLVFGFTGLRTNNALVVQSLSPQGFSGKGSVDRTSGLVFSVVASTYQCEANKLPAGASLAGTRAHAQAFLDAYNVRDTTRIIRLMDMRVVYRDMAHCGSVTSTGRRAVARWLTARFREWDSLAPASRILGALPGTAAVTVPVARSSD